MAASWLESRGYSIVSRRYRTRSGEIDLVVSKGPLLAFVEVKTRHGDAFGYPAESVGRIKQRRIARVASHFMARTGYQGTCRFDVITVLLEEGEHPRIEHIPDAFRL